MKTTVFQRHHIVYKDDKNKEVIRVVRKGVHQILGLIKRFKHLTPEEINAIILEAELKRNFEDGRSEGNV